MNIEHLENKYMEDDKLNFEEFKEFFLSYIPTEHLSEKFYDNNSNLCDSIIFDCWKYYLDYQLVDITVFCKTIESVFINLFRYKPVLDNSEYES